MNIIYFDYNKYDTFLEKHYAVHIIPCEREDSVVTLYGLIRVMCVFSSLMFVRNFILSLRFEAYAGTVDAWHKIYKYEGISGLYRGFWVSTFQIISGVFYISTYESVRHLMNLYNANSRVKSMVAGGSASLVGQTIIVPFDVLSQHLMMLGVVETGRNKQKVIITPLGISLDSSKSKLKITLDICKYIYLKDGIKGFYRGYVASLCSYVPNSALWWTFYHLYQDELCTILPGWVSHLFIQCLAGTLGGFTTTLLTNPLDIIRARLQVQRLDSMQKTFQILWLEERLRIFTKGLSARMVQSAFFSSAIILGYESIKRVSVNEEYREFIRW